MLNLVTAFLVSLMLIAAVPATQARHAGAGHAQTPRDMDASNWMHMPYSGDYLFAAAVRHGWITPPVGRSFLASRPDLSCRTQLPCVFPNVDADGGSKPVNETPIAVNPKNHRQLIAGGNDFNCTTDEGYEVSSNGGKTWNHECGVLESGTGYGDPIVGFDLAGAAWRGGIDTFASGDAVIVDKSTDGGTTWSTPVSAASNLYTPGFVDKPWLQIDTTPSSPRVGTMYVSATQFDGSQDTEITVSHSTDGGATWTMVPIGQRVNYPKDNMWSDLAIGPDGTVYVTWMRCAANSTTGACGGTVATMLIASSTDGGNTWSAASKIERVHLASSGSCNDFWGCLPNTYERLADLPATAVDESSRSHKGTLYTIDYNYTGAFCQVVVTKSTDGGATWSTPVAVASPIETHDQFMPWINVSSSGLVGATWLDRRNDPANHDYEAFAGVSADGGRTWSNVQLAASLSDPDNDGFSGMFMGDYTGNAWDGRKLYATWTDTTLGTGNDFAGGLRI